MDVDIACCFDSGSHFLLGINTLARGCKCRLENVSPVDEYCIRLKSSVVTPYLGVGFQLFNPDTTSSSYVEDVLRRFMHGTAEQVVVLLVIENHTPDV